MMTPGVSAGSNQVGASVTWIAHVISPAGAAQATVAPASRTMSRTAASRPARVMGLRDGLQRSGHESAPHDHVRPPRHGACDGTGCGSSGDYARNPAHVNRPGDRVRTAGRGAGSSGGRIAGRLAQGGLAESPAQLVHGRRARRDGLTSQRSAFRRPGKSTSMTPSRMVSTPCPGIPGTERTTPTAINRIPSRFRAIRRSCARPRVLDGRVRAAEIVLREPNDRDRHRDEAERGEEDPESDDQEQRHGRRVDMGMAMIVPRNLQGGTRRCRLRASASSTPTGT